MATTLTVLGKMQPLLTIPEDFTRITSEPRSRNGEAVRVDRYQHQRPVQWYGSHLTLVWGEDGRLLSFNDFTGTSSAPLPTQAAARQIAMQVWQALDPSYAAGLDYMRTDRLTRYYEVDDQRIAIPVWWVKFAHRNGSYNWVSVGAGGQVVEMERESMWDYMRSRRATEEWNYDDWVLARAGQGPQPAAPAALA